MEIFLWEQRVIIYIYVLVKFKLNYGDCCFRAVAKTVECRDWTEKDYWLLLQNSNQ